MQTEPLHMSMLYPSSRGTPTCTHQHCLPQLRKGNRMWTWHSSVILRIIIKNLVIVALQIKCLSPRRWKNPRSILTLILVIETQDTSITSIASWSFSISSPFFFSAAAAFLVVTTVTTLVTVGPDFYKNSSEKLLCYPIKEKPYRIKSVIYLYFWMHYPVFFPLPSVKFYQNNAW